MDEHVPDYYPSISMRLKEALDIVGYSLADRHKKERLSIESEVYLSFTRSAGQSRKQFSPYICGSRSEGSTGPGLDADTNMLLINDSCNVVISYSECQRCESNILIERDVHTHPGYVKLVWLDTLPHNTYVSSFHPIDYLSSTRPISMSSGTNQANSRPMMHYRHSLKLYSLDWLHAYRCFGWPEEGSEWFIRDRFHGWPSAHQIENARNYGCFVTPIGHPCSDVKHLEWRLSFSLAERELIRSFEDTVMKVYVLLKMIKKTFIEPHLGSAFSTYHCKVCMLWMRERIFPELWRTENLLYCLTLCLRQLADWVMMGYCPDYFIVENNIYDTTIFGATRFKLLMILKFLLSQDCRFLLAIECCGIGYLLASRSRQLDTEWLLLEELMLDHEIVIGSACQCRTLIMTNGLLSRIYSFPWLWHATKQAHCFLQIPMYYVLMIICEKLGFYIASICKANVKTFAQKNLEYLINFATKLFSFCICSDATSVRLKLCAIGIVLENYCQTEIYLQDISDHCMEYIYSCTGFELTGPRVVNYSLKSFRNYTEIHSSLDLLQRLSSYVVVYQPYEICIAPIPLRMEIVSFLVMPPVVKPFWHDCAVVDSHFCLHLLTFLNFANQNKVHHKQIAMSNMIHLIRTEPDIPHRDRALNLLGYCFLLENEPEKAFLCFIMSLKIMPYHNAAKLYMGVLIQKTSVTHETNNLPRIHEY